MPINIPDGLPAKQTLREERIFALEEEDASLQRIRPLHVAILNLMPTKIETETQILRLISKSPLQVSCDFMRVSSHESKNTSADHLVKFYDTFDSFRDKIQSHSDDNYANNVKLKLTKEIEKLRSELSLWENNLGFFASSKQADLLKEEFEKKMQAARQQIALLEAKLRIVDENESEEEK